MSNLICSVTAYYGSTDKSLINYVKKAIIVDNILKTLLKEARYVIRPYA